MKLRYLIGKTLPFACIAFASPVFATDLQIENPQPRDQMAYNWLDESIWSDGTPVPGSNVTMAAQSDGSSPVEVEVYLANENATIGSLDIFYNVSLRVTDGNFSVSGDTYAEGFLAITRGTMSLGTNTQYDSSTRTLNGGQCLVSDGNSATQTIYEWRGADIVTNNGGFNLFGSNVVVRDQNTGLNAFRNLAENGNFLTMDDGYVMHVAGNFKNTSNGSITLNLNVSERTPRLEIAGNFINDGEVELRGNTVMSVSGGLSGSGKIILRGSQNQVSIVGAYTQTGGEVNLGEVGGSGIDSFTLKADAQIYDGGATITGSGTLEGNVTITSATISPGASPGQVAVLGDLTLAGDARLVMEIGGTQAVQDFDRIVQSGGSAGVILGGELELNVIRGYEDTILSETEFAILTSDAPLAGGFSNVDSGGRLLTSDGRGSFLVDYAGNEVVLSDYQIVVESFSTWLARYDLPSGQDGALADPNEDGVSNIEAYFRGMSPVGEAVLKPYTAVRSGGGVQIAISASKAVEGLTVKTEVSTNLINWTPGPPVSPISETAARSLKGITLPIGAGLPRFARFSFELQTP